ncbi:MAG: hypothetical protein AAF456_09415 [Planctomycetota bacterium]
MKLLVLLALTAVLSGCGNPYRAKLTGKWELETAGSLSSRLDNDGSSGDDAADANAGSGEALPGESKMTIEFRSTGELITTTNIGSIDHSKTGTWELVSYDEATATATIKSILEMQETETLVKFENDDTIEMIPPNLAGLSLKHTFTRSR